MSELTHVKGLAELQKFLDELPAKMEKNIMRGALRAGANVIKKEAKANCPIGQPSDKNRKIYGGYEGALRDSLRVSTNSKGGTVTASIKAGGETKKGADVYYARWVEFGTTAHPIKAGLLVFQGRFAKSVDHPGAKPKPFMRPALDNKAQDAVIAAGNYIKNRLATKEGLDTSDIEIGADK